MGKGIALLITALLGGIFFSNEAFAQVTLGDTWYVQNFDSIDDGLPPGWSVWTGATAGSLGEGVFLETNRTSWADTTPEFRNSGSITNNAGLLHTNAASTTQHIFTNRVLAVRQGSSFGDPGAAFVFQVSDTLDLADLEFSVDFLMLDEEGRETTWTVDYGFGSAPTEFTVLGTYTNDAALGTVFRQTYLLGADANNQSEVVTVRIAALDGATGSGSRDTFGIDNVRLSYNRGEVEEVRLRAARVGDEFVLTWDDASFGLQSAPTPAGSFADLPGATSPHAVELVGDQQFFRLSK